MPEPFIGFVPNLMLGFDFGLPFFVCFFKESNPVPGTQQNLLISVRSFQLQQLWIR